MGTDDEVEACGRCSMSSVVGLTDGGGPDRDPFGGDRIELPDVELRRASRHVVALGRVKERLDGWVHRHTYGR